MSDGFDEFSISVTLNFCRGLIIWCHIDLDWIWG